MCLPIDSCFGFGAPLTDDDLGPPPKHVPPPSRGHPAQRNGAGGGHRYNGNGAVGYYHNGNSYPAHGAAETDRKAANDVRAARGWHGHAATAAQEKADGALKPQPVVARNGRVAAADGQGARGVAQHYYYYEPAHKEDAADSYYPATTATADHESRSDALAEE